jgi:KUP system potassium uptake protein
MNLRRWGRIVSTSSSTARTVGHLGVSRAAATLGALGIVYGDIGTSPLYAFKEAIKAATADSAPIAGAVLGIISLIIWALILIISLKYAVLILRAEARR